MSQRRNPTLEVNSAMRVCVGPGSFTDPFVNDHEFVRSAT